MAEFIIGFLCGVFAMLSVVIVFAVRLALDIYKDS